MSRRRTCGSPRLTEGHSFGDHLISVKLTSVAGASFYSAVFCAFVGRVRYNLEERVFIYDYYVNKKKLIQIMQEKISP
jgi:hypothetical protein